VLFEQKKVGLKNHPLWVGSHTKTNVWTKKGEKGASVFQHKKRSQKKKKKKKNPRGHQKTTTKNKPRKTKKKKQTTGKKTIGFHKIQMRGKTKAKGIFHH